MFGITPDFIVFVSTFALIGLLYIGIFMGLKILLIDGFTHPLLQPLANRLNQAIDNMEEAAKIQRVLRILNWFIPGLGARSLIYIFASIILGFLIPYYIFTSGISQDIFTFIGVKELYQFRNPEQQFVNMLARGSVYSLFALGYALIFSILGVLNLAHSSVYMWGSFGGLFVTVTFGTPVWLALPVAMLVAGLFGILVDLIAFLPLRLRNAPRISQLITSIGLAIFLVNFMLVAQTYIAQQDYFRDHEILLRQKESFPRESLEETIFFKKVPLDAEIELQTLDLGLFEIDLQPLDILGVHIWTEIPFLVRPIQWTMFAISMILMLILRFLVLNTKIGKAMRVVAFNQQTAKLLGINVTLVFLFTFFLAGALAGAAGVLQAMAFTVDPFMGEQVALVGLTVIVLGGMGNIEAAVVGAFLVANMQIATIATGYSWMEEAIVFLALFLTLLIRPQGLLGEPLQDRA